MAEFQSARMSKITDDDLTWSGTGCFLAVPIWRQWASKEGLTTEIEGQNVTSSVQEYDCCHY